MHQTISRYLPTNLFTYIGLRILVQNSQTISRYLPNSLPRTVLCCSPPHTRMCVGENVAHVRSCDSRKVTRRPFMIDSPLDNA